MGFLAGTNIWFNYDPFSGKNLALISIKCAVFLATNYNDLNFPLIFSIVSNVFPMQNAKKKKKLLVIPVNSFFPFLTTFFFPFFFLQASGWFSYYLKSLYFQPNPPEASFQSTFHSCCLSLLWVIYHFQVWLVTAICVAKYDGCY